MCESLKKKEQRDRITGAIEGMRIAGMTDNDIVTKIIENFHVTKEFVMSLLAPKTA